LLLGYTHQLEQFFTVFSLTEGQAAIDLVKDHEPDFFKAVVLDVNMPVMGGLEVAREIQNLYELNPEQMPLIFFLSGDLPAYY
jgi:CheY-like chemotaxis protein